MADTPTPSMQQYLKAKAEHPDCVVLFRMGDFYETFYEDATDVAKLLDIALTSRNKDDPDPIPMAGVPWHAVSGYISRLLEAGRRVAIAEQMEDPKQAKGIVRREVVRVVTPGVLLDSELTDPVASNHLVAIVPEARGYGIAALDASTGAFAGTLATTADELSVLLNRLVVREVLAGPEDDGTVARCAASLGALLTPIRPEDDDAGRLSPVAAVRVPAAPVSEGLCRAATRVLAYLGRTHPALLDLVRPLEPLAANASMNLPLTTVRNLELVSTMATGRAGGSLYAFLNRTRTAMGARLLRTWVLAPLLDVDRIAHRQDRVGALVGEPACRGAVRDELAGVADVERMLSRLAGGAASARDLNSLARAVRALERSIERLRNTGNGVLSALAALPAGVADLAASIERTFVDEPPQSTRDAGMVRKGVLPELDEATDLAENGRRYIAEYEARERERTGIATLRVKYNRVFGYTIEVTRSRQDQVPADYVRRQTLAGAERFTTPELSDLEHHLTTAEEKARQLESTLFEEARARVLAARESLQAAADALAAIDAVATLAEVAHLHDWHRPVVTTDRALRIVQGRHPIVEANLPVGTFVPNDFDLDGTNTTLTILTGPNMAGKSTVMRQVALTVLLAQAGSFVPAASAEIGVADAIFTRVGAMDDLAAGRSTFMVEMSEAAEMLARATDRSLLVLDEIGRGTSTFDGVAIAWAVAEHIQGRIGCRTLFATHYHELTDLVRSVPRARNQSIAVKEWGGEVLFLRKLVDGPASKSYGIQVARLAGLPAEVIARAREVLANLETSELDAVGQPVLAKGRRGSPRRTSQLDLFGMPDPGPRPDPIVERLAALDPDRLTPIEALQVLSDLSGQARRARQDKQEDRNR
jgi:DNA mismatch repair protein MutS